MKRFNNKKFHRGGKALRLTRKFEEKEKEKLDNREGKKVAEFFENNSIESASHANETHCGKKETESEILFDTILLVL